MYDLVAGFHALDQGILLSLRRAQDLGLPIGPHWLTGFMRDVTALGGYHILCLVALATSAYFAATGRWIKGMLLLASFAAAVLLNEALKATVDRPRPDLVPHLIKVSSSSFPSSHAMMSAMLYLTLGFMAAEVETRPAAKRYWITLAVLTTALIGFSRAYLGVHWPSDIAAGWLIGCAWALGARAVARHMRRRGEE